MTKLSSNEEQIVEIQASDLSADHWSLLLSADPEREKILAYLPSCRIFSIKRQAQTIAIALLQNVAEKDAAEDSASPKECELINIAVAEDFQGQGLAKRLIQHCIDIAKDLACQEMWIGTGNSSLSQLALYQKMGFRIVEVVPDFFSAYSPRIIENGIVCQDMLRLKRSLL